MWGFMVTVRARDATSTAATAAATEVNKAAGGSAAAAQTAAAAGAGGGLPFLADLALGLSVLACSMLNMLYQGPETSKDEEKCQHVLKSKLLQRCVSSSYAFCFMVHLHFGV